MSALLAAAARELIWGLPAVAGEIGVWRRRAQVAPDPPLRGDALNSLARKRPNADGAALFWVIPRRRSPRLLGLLVAYQTMWDYLDSASERGAGAGEANGHQLHRALAAAFEPEAPLPDHYKLHPWQDDRGYLDALVRACRSGCRALPSYMGVHLPIRDAAQRCAVQALNHNPDPRERERSLRAWAARECPDAGAPWFELAAAASASVLPHALLALAAEPACQWREIPRQRIAYETFSLAIAMLDSYADLEEDDESDAHSYVAHYPDPRVATERVAEIIAQAMSGARELRDGHRHAVVAGCMVAMYLSKESSRMQTPARHRLAHAGGSLTTLLLPILRFWRAAYALRSA